jgi:hypothetical protein
VIGEPPLTLIEFRDRCAVKERETVQVCQRVRDFVFMPIDCADSCTSARFQNLVTATNGFA